MATELTVKTEAIQVATLLTVIGEEAREVFSTFNDWARAGDETKIEPVLQKFEQYCEPHRNVPFERYRFNRRVQEAGETYDQYRTALLKLAAGCDFQTISPNEILRDRLVFGVSDAKVRERLLRESKLTLAKTDEICHAAESMVSQLKAVEDTSGVIVNVVESGKEVSKFRGSEAEVKRSRECWNCGRKHEYYKKELCPAYGKTCTKCHKLNHFAVKCRGGKGTQHGIKAVDGTEDNTEIFQVSNCKFDESQFVTLELESGKYMRFQADTGAQCNVVPL